MGQHRRGHGTDPPDRRQIGLRPDHPADHHRVRRQDGQNCSGRHLAYQPIGYPPTTIGSSGATPTTPTSAASCACSPTCHWRKSLAWKCWAAPRSTRPKRSSPPRRPPSPTASTRRSKPPKPPAAPSRKAKPPPPCPPSRSQRRICWLASPPSAYSPWPALPPATPKAAASFAAGGARVNDETVTEEGRLLSAELLRDGAIKLSAGRKQHRLVKIEGY